MKTHLPLLSFVLLPLLVTASKSKPYAPSSALEYQQSTNSRIVVEENFLRFFTGANERMTIDGNGNVGIGTASPSTLLEIVSPSISGSERFQKFQVGDATDDYLQIANATGSNGQFIPSIRGYHVSDNRSALYMTGAIEAANDSGSTPIMMFDSRLNTTSVATRPLFGWDSYGNRKMTLTAEGKLGIGTASPGNYKLNVHGQIMASGMIDIGMSRPASAYTEGLFVKGVDGNGYASIQLATKSWSGSHAILFNAYKSSSQVSGSLASVGNTKFTHNVGNYSGGAGAIMFFGNGGGMNFYISQTSTGVETNVNWSTPKMRIQRDGTVGINISDPNETYKLHVNGKTYATSFHTAANNYADFVFKDDYKLKPLSEVESYIEKNNHLPDIPSEAEAKANGVDLQSMQAKLLQKIEELTLYMIEQNKKIESQSALLQKQQKRIQQLERNQK